jgi:hypothetical protein
MALQVKHRGHEDDEVKVLDVIQTIKSVQAETVKRGRLPGVGIIYCTYVETVSEQSAGNDSELNGSVNSSAKNCGRAVSPQTSIMPRCAISRKSRSKKPSSLAK